MRIENAIVLLGSVNCRNDWSASVLACIVTQSRSRTVALRSIELPSLTLGLLTHHLRTHRLSPAMLR